MKSSEIVLYEMKDFSATFEKKMKSSEIVLYEIVFRWKNAQLRIAGLENFYNDIANDEAASSRWKNAQLRIAGLENFYNDIANVTHFIYPKNDIIEPFSKVVFDKEELV
ncbi:hypothetical protein QE152_g24409 [Popillia japonica]|uniref:Uncharacterized protein n=1 Tax=Popillia japonica TaxID=7064 RepID=A0AAW1KF16_POPJA